MDVIKEIRTQRASAMKSESQYVYLHRVLCEYAYSKKIDREKIIEFFTAYTAYIDKKKEKKRRRYMMTVRPHTTAFVRKDDWI